ncbi:MAG TPA: hypothetical protein VK484_05405, partial [Ferruginibacter sp.]|nr:hypothetical protein [Ferruginibacter sp.]
MRVFLFLVILTANSKAIAQIEAKTIDFSNKLEINLKNDSTSTFPQNLVTSVNVIDARDDTS